MESHVAPGAPPPSLWRVLRTMGIIGRMAVRRRLNRAYGHLSATFGRKKRKGEADEAQKPHRPATARKRPVGRVLFVVVAALFFFNGVQVSGRLIGALSDRSLARNGFEMGDAGFEAIQNFLSQFPERIESSDSGEKNDDRQQWLDYLRESFLYDLRHSERCIEDCEARADRMLESFLDKGASVFYHRPAFSLLPSVELWPEQARGELMARLGFILVLLSALLFFSLLGSADRDLGKVQWDMEWLYTFPVSARVLFLARVFEQAFGSVLTWLAVFPFLFSMLWCAGYRWWSLPFGLMLSVYAATLVGSLFVAAETFLRKSVAPGGLKNLQALFSVVSMLFLMALVLMAFSPSAAFLLDLVERVPLRAAWNPFSAPALLLGGGREAIGSMGMMALAALVLPLGAVWASEWRVRDGLVTSASTYHGKRGKADPIRKTRGWEIARLRGVFAKELRLLFRDRTRFAQAVVAPVLVAGLQIAMVPEISRSALADSRHLATLAFGIGVFALMNSAFAILIVEGEALWMLYTFPRELHSILLQKTFLWCGLAFSYAVVILLLFFPSNPSLSDLSNAVTALVGVIIYSFIASGIGVLGTDPLETERQRKLRVEMAYLYMLLASLYAYAIYSPSVWNKIAQITLCSLLAFALWQKVRDRSSYWLDPTQEPPARISLADGLIAVLVFFVLQGLLAMAMLFAGSSPGWSLLVAFVLAGDLVVFFTLYTFWRQKVPDLLTQIGLRREEQGRPFLFSIRTGVAGGAIAALIGGVYLKAIETFEPLRVLWQDSFRLSDLDLVRSGWFLALAVIAAPIFEEYLFRGLVYRGLRRSTGPLLSTLGSAAVFAIVHPAIAVIPVFVMGCLAALSFEKTGLLLSPIVVHMVYNFVMVGLANL